MVTVPPKPAVFAAEASVPGVEIRFVTFWQDPKRYHITPRMLLVHTNGASGEGSIDSAWNWAHAVPNKNTCPHYQVDRTHNGVTRARKMLPTDRKGIANATVTSENVQWPTLTAAQRAEISVHGHIANWSLAIETADLGWPTPGHACGFDPGQGELIAQIIAYESIVHDFPIEIPDHYWGSGVGAHTDPYGFPFTTTSRGKPCPGDQKKADLRNWIIPRAREIRNAWVGGPIVIDPPPDDEEFLMAAIQAIYKPGPGVTRPNPKWFVLRADGGIRHASGPDVEHGATLNVPTYTIGGDEHYDQLDTASQK